MTPETEYRILLLARLYQLRVPSPLGRGVEFAGTVYVSNDESLVRSYLTPAVVRSLGTLQTDYLTHSEIFAHCESRITAPAVTAEDVHERLLAFLHVLNVLLNGLWLISDHAGDTEEAFAIVSSGAALHSVHSNFLGQRYSTADGEHPPSIITPEELRLARGVGDKLLGLRYDEFTVGPRPVTQLVRDESRLTRCLYILQAARTSPDLAVRIAFYSMCLETLFSVDSQEISHKVAERVAHFLAGTANDRWTAYKAVKRGYDVRSQTVHGTGIRRVEEATDVSRALDRILRQVLVKVLGDESLVDLFTSAGNDRLGRYLERLVFALPETTP